MSGGEPSGEALRRRLLGDFLKARRSRTVRAELGLKPVGTRITGLRREEVAGLSGVSITWYSWLEQGRASQPSRQVLDALAGTLHMSVAEHCYVLSLARYAGPQRTEDQIPRTAPAHVLRLLDEIGDLPAYVMAPDWRILGWTTAFARLYPHLANVAEPERNLLWLVFTDPKGREVWPDWKLTTRRFLAEFRADAGPRVTAPPLSDLIDELRDACPAFRDAWERHDVCGFTSPERLVRHAVGDLHLVRHRLTLSSPPDLHMSHLQLVLYTPGQSSETRELLRQICA
jgi:transcriptional regulator with XRE-family HTH domain